MSALFPILIFAFVWSGLVWFLAVRAEKPGAERASWSVHWLAHIIMAAVPPAAALVFLALPDLARPAFLPDLTPLPVAEVTPDGTTGAAAAPGIWEMVTAALPGVLAFAVVAGAIWQLFRLAAGKWRLYRLVGKAKKIRPFSDTTDILSSEDTLTPFALGANPFLRTGPRIVLPSALLTELDEASLNAILAHEDVHIRRHDPEAGTLLGVIAALFWFSPFIHDLVRRWRLATELQADAGALEGASTEMRKAYAESLLTALRIPAGQGVRPLAASFSTHHLRSEKMRIKTIMRGTDSLRKGRAMTAGLVLSGLVTLAAGATGALALTASTAAADNSPIVSEGRITSSYGVVRMVNKDGMPKVQKEADSKELKPRFHNGVDIAAKKGTPVHAPAGGWVVAATDLYDDNPRYGKVVIIETQGGVRTFFAHLDSYNVKAGQVIQAGEKFAEVGNTGVSSGPHVHLEVFVNGERVDPVTVWGNLIG